MRSLILVLLLAGCSAPRPSEEVLFTDPMDSVHAVLTKTGVTLDDVISHDGRGSIRIDSREPTTIRIAEFAPGDAENAKLFYRAVLRTQDLTGQAYLEMWCTVPGRGEFFSRALHAPLSGTTEWVSQETPFYLDRGQRAKTIKLNVVVSGSGTVWVDDVVLAKAPR